MSQKKINPASLGIWPALRGSVLPLVAQPQHRDAAKRLASEFPSETTRLRKDKPGEKFRTPDAEVIEKIVSRLAVIAVEPTGVIATKCTPKGLLQTIFVIAPDLTLAVMTKARDQWHGDKRSKDTLTQQIYQWLANGCSNPWFDMKNLSKSDSSPMVREDKDMAFEFAESGGTSMPGTEDDLKKLVEKFEKARKKLVRHIKEGKAFRL